MIEFIICDDNLKIVNEAAEIVNKVMINNNMHYKITKFLDYDNKFMDVIKDNSNYKIYILDIEMPSLSGIDVARKIRSKDKTSAIIFLTGHDELGFVVLKGCLNFLTFISKFDDYNKNLEDAVVEALDTLSAKQAVEFVEHGVKYSLLLNSILYVTRDTIERKTIIKTDSNEYKVYIPLEKFNVLTKDRLIKTHKSCLVNMNRVEKLDANHNLITFDNGLVIDLLSNKYKKELVKNG